MSTKTLYGYCGRVSTDGLIISNGNFSCTVDSNVYTVKYPEPDSSMVPVITGIATEGGLSFTFEYDENGFTVSTIIDSTTTGTPDILLPNGFTFICARIL
ncbi:MAG: hypothetical protein AB8B56_08990 [Crocinitomicaceae bacterium]